MVLFVEANQCDVFEMKREGGRKEGRKDMISRVFWWG